MNTIHRSSWENSSDIIFWISVAIFSFVILWTLTTQYSRILVLIARCCVALSRRFSAHAIKVIQLHEDCVCPVAIAETVGQRDYMEDRYAVCGSVAGCPTATAYCICDGHGGSRAAEFVSSRIRPTLDTCLGSPLTNRSTIGQDTDGISKGLSTVFKALDAAWLRLAEIQQPPMDDGTTAVVALVLDHTSPKQDKNKTEEDGDHANSMPSTARTCPESPLQTGHEIWVANAGDSRAILVASDGTCIALSDDHKPNRQDEQLRIRKHGGTIQFFGVWRVEGMLAVSRAIGDRILKRFITATPEIKYHHARSKEIFILLATDGVWDVMTNAEVAALLYAHQHESVDVLARTIVQESLARGSTDNITVALVDLRSNECHSQSTDVSSYDAFKEHTPYRDQTEHIATHDTQEMKAMRQRK